MQFLITGGAGFIGHALASRLLDEGHSVRVVDDLSAGDPGRLPEDAIFARGDVNDVPRLWTLLQGVDCVYHLAARVSVSESIRYPREYNTVNVGGTVSVLEAMRDVGVKRLVFASSGAIYGDQGEQPLHEALPPDPRSPYAVSKLAAEHYIRTVGRLWQVETVSLRVFNAYGPLQQLPNAHPPVIPQFIRQALGGGSLVLHNNGTQTRDFVYLDDVVDALVAAATAPDIDRKIINVGSGVETSIRALALAVGEVTGRDVHLLNVGAESGGVSRMCADLTRARALLGYEPKVFLNEGLQRMVERDVRFKRLASREA
ncbi:MAG: NAD-dependent epimerase/dehydratase family protein [Chloroflexi bacterium]|nr:NAD-dependent epimerase/dehydratase family protein [Chloroflexota bacterium]